MENRTNFTIFSYQYLDTNELRLYWEGIDTIFIVFCSLVSVLGTVGNGLVIFITGFRMKKTVHTVWILNLAIADFIFSFFLPFSIVYVGLGFHWPFGSIMCKLQEAVLFLNLFASVYTMMVISVDRCIAVWCPVWAQNHRTPQLAYYVVLGVWILAVILCSPYSYSKQIHNYNVTILCLNTFGTIDEWKRIWNALVLIRCILVFTIPFCVIVVCYGAIVVRLKRGHLSQSSRPFKVITAVIVAFFVCWFPFHLFSLLELKVSPKNFLVIITGQILSYNLAYFNSCLNPILYFCMGHNFKGKLKCSLLSALANAFTEDGNLNHRKTPKDTPLSFAELDSHNM